MEQIEPQAPRLNRQYKLLPRIPQLAPRPVEIADDARKIRHVRQTESGRPPVQKHHIVIRRIPLEENPQCRTGICLHTVSDRSQKEQIDADTHYVFSNCFDRLKNSTAAKTNI